MARWWRGVRLPTSTLAVFTLAVLTLFGARAGAAWSWSQQTVARQAGDEVAAVELTRVRHELAGTLNRAFMARLLEEAGVALDGAGPAASGAAAEREIQSATDRLRRLEDTVVGPEAQAVRLALAGVPPLDAADLSQAVTQPANQLLPALLEPDRGTARPFFDVEQVVDDSDATVSVTSRVLNGYLGAERVAGLDAAYSEALVAYLDPLPSLDLDVPATIQPRRVEAPPDALFIADYRDEFDLLGLAGFDPVTADALEDVLSSDDGVRLLSADQWASNLLNEEIVAPRPITLQELGPTLFTFSDRTDAVVDGILERTRTDAVRRADRARPRSLAGAVATAIAAIAGLTALALVFIKRGKEQRALRAAAELDPLTGLGNRRALRPRAQELLLASEDVFHVVMHLDLDGFKHVNDAHGHAAGDELLVRFAAILCAAVRNGDTVARVGGDEFVIVLFDFAGDEEARATARTVAERVHALMADLEGGPPAGIGVSIGVAVVAGPVDLDQATGWADVALYEAKRGGRGRTVTVGPGPPRPRELGNEHDQTPA